jgi:hypothetical protein
MPKWGNYIGLFSGMLFIILGIALRYLPVPATAPWMQEVVPYFLIGYGILRIGMSLYFLRRAQRKNIIPLVLLSVSLWHCKGGPEENLRIRFAYDGECASCPLARMDSLLRYYFPKAIVDVSYDSTKQEVLLLLDSNHVRIDTLIQVLLAYGYEVNDQLPSDPLLSSCCTPLEAVTHTEGGSFFAEANPKEEVSLLEQEIEAQLLEEPALPQEDLSLDDDLGELENFDISEGGAEAGLDEGLDDLGLEDDLDLELEPKPKKNTSQQKKTPQKP